uniref:Uncharacterized protein n=1 Tax=Opuntia streptacantha TaxID=393608 RepID=A0A7C8ZXB0_OPUST
MVDIKFVDKLWVRIRNKEFSSRAIRDSNLPQSRPISWGFINKFTHINDMPCCYVNSGIVFVVSNEARDPSIQIVAPWPYVVDFEMTFIIRSCPELIPLTFPLPGSNFPWCSESYICCRR